MLIGKIDLDKNILRKYLRDPEKIKEYSNSVIPKEFNHLKELQDNQLYYTAMFLRKMGLSDYKTIQDTINALLSGVRITGYVDELIEVDSLYMFVDMDRVNLYLERL